MGVPIPTPGLQAASDAEAQAGSVSDKAVVPSNLSATLLGVGQTVQELSGSRALGATYTNTTGRTIYIIVDYTTTLAETPLIVINGVDVYGTAQDVAGYHVGISAVIPKGATYSVVAGGTPTLARWIEITA